MTDFVAVMRGFCLFVCLFKGVQAGVTGFS